MSHKPMLCTLLLLSLVVQPAHAAPSYSVLVNGVPRGSAVPFSLDTSYVAANAFNTLHAQLHVEAGPGMAYIHSLLEDTWLTNLSFAAGLTVSATASTDDFELSGPPGATSVTGTFYFTIVGSTSLGGGYAGNDGHGGKLAFSVQAPAGSWYGEWWEGNGSTGGAYGLTGASSPDRAVAITGTFPVGVFRVTVSAGTASATYGNMSTSPGLIECIAASAPAGLPQASIGNPDGRVMELPPGYDVNSAAWNVVHNQFLSPRLGASPATPHGALAVRSGNPGSGATRLEFTLANSGHAQLRVFDTAGRRVATLADGMYAAGRHPSTWDGRDDSGESVAPGVYFAVLTTNRRSDRVRLVRLR